MRRIFGLLVGGLLLFSLASAPLAAQSTTASRAASELLAGGSELVVAGSIELLAGGAGLVVASAEQAGETIVLVLEPIADGLSGTAEASAAVVVELSVAAWQTLRESGQVSSDMIGGVAKWVGKSVEAIALTTASVTVGASQLAASGVVLGFVLVVENVVLGVAALPPLEGLLGHSVHSTQ